MVTVGCLGRGLRLQVVLVGLCVWSLACDSNDPGAPAGQGPSVGTTQPAQVPSTAGMLPAGPAPAMPAVTATADSMAMGAPPAVQAPATSTPVAVPPVSTPAGGTLDAPAEMAPMGTDALPMPDAGMAAAGMVAMEPDLEPVAEQEAPPREDLGEGPGTDVIAIGDSWMNLNFASGIQQSLTSASGQRYRAYGFPGTRLLNEQIPDQYEQAKREDEDIKTVVMTGGGNDIIQVPGLRDDCDAMGELCTEEVGKILDRLSSLWEEMAADGVQDVLYVQYSDPELNEVDFALANGDGLPARCAAVPEPLRCHLLATADLVMGDIPDGIHPSGAGYDRIGEAAYGLMVEQGMRR